MSKTSSIDVALNIVKNEDSLNAEIICIPSEIDDKVLKIQSMGVEIDKSTWEQYNYIHDYLESA